MCTCDNADDDDDDDDDYDDDDDDNHDMDDDEDCVGLASVKGHSFLATCDGNLIDRYLQMRALRDMSKHCGQAWIPDTRYCCSDGFQGAKFAANMYQPIEPPPF